MKPATKICGLTREEDIALAKELGADFFGLIVYAQSPRAVSIDRAVELMREIPAGRAVLVDVNTGTDDLRQFTKLGFGAYQIHVDLNLSLVNAAAWSGMVGADKLWLAPRLPPGEPFPQDLLNFAETFLLDTYSNTEHGGTGRTGDWSGFADWQAMYPHKQFVLAGGLNPANVKEALASTGANFVDVNSGVEASPGVKDHEKLRQLFEVLNA